MKKGISLRLLVEIDKILSEAEYEYLKVRWSIATLEELYEAKAHLQDIANASDMSKKNLAAALERTKVYLTEDEMKWLDTPGQKFALGALDPNKPPSKKQKPD